MAKPTPKSPVPLEAFLRALLAGDDKHRPEKALPADLRALLESTLADLSSLNATVRTSRETYRSSSKARKGQVPQDRVVAERIRNAVYMLYTMVSEELRDYGLVPHKRHHHHKGDAGADGQSGGHRGGHTHHASGEGATTSNAGETGAKAEGETPKPAAPSPNPGGTANGPATT